MQIQNLKAYLSTYYRYRFSLFLLLIIVLLDIAIHNEENVNLMVKKVLIVPSAFAQNLVYCLMKKHVFIKNKQKLCH